jgi:hypothetical protein
VLARALLRVDKLIAQHNLESAALRGDENYFVEIVLKLCKYLFRQTDGFRSVASLRAVLDGDPHVAESSE